MARVFIPCSHRRPVAGYPLPRKGYFNIGLLHTCASGREGHESYAPCDINYLKNKGYDYWALGHVHKAEIISKEPWIVFPGNTQGRHIREEGAKGCTVAQVCDGRLESLEHHSLDVLRWSRCMIDAAGAETFEEIMQRAEKKIDEELSKCEGRLLALRVIVFGACEIHRKLVNNLHGLKNNLRSLAAEQGPEAVWLEKVKVETTPKVGMEDLVASYPVASLLQYIEEFSKDNHFLQELASELERDKNALPADLFKKGEIDPADINYLQSLLPEVEAIILSRLLERRGSAVRFKRINLKGAFRPFKDYEIDFGKTGSLILFMANEAGKTTVLRAITDFLYGIPQRSPDAFFSSTCQAAY